MWDLQCILSSRLMPGREFGAPVSDGGDSYYPVRVPSAGFGENERDMWDIVYVPAYLLTAVKFTPDETDYEIFGYDCDVTVDGESIFPVFGKPGLTRELYARFGDFGIITADARDSFRCRCPVDGSERMMSCRELFNRLTAKNELDMSRLPGSCSEDDVYRSCSEDYQDESPVVRTVRSVRLGSTPSENPDRYRDWYASVRDYDDLPATAGFCNLSHTVLRKDMIDAELVEVGGRPCRRVYVPTPSGFFAKTPDDKSLCDAVYVPAEYFSDLPKDFDLARDGGPYQDPEKSGLRPMVNKRSGLFTSQYALCSIPVFADGGYPIFNADGSRSRVTPNAFSAGFTCLTSEQIYEGNLMCDVDGRFSRLYDTVMSSSVGGAFLNRLEMRTDIPSVDFEKNERDELVKPDLDSYRDIRKRIREYNRSETVRSGEMYSGRPCSHPVRRLNSRVERESCMRTMLGVSARDKVNLNVVSKADDELTFEEFEAGGEPEYAPVSDSSYGGPVSVPEVSGGRDTSDLDDEAASLYVPGEPDDSASEVYQSF